VDADCRGHLVRMCPDCLTTDDQLRKAALSISLA
jgi:hypothetical protein